MYTRLKLILYALILIILLICTNTDTFLVLISGDPEALRELSRGSVVILLLFTIVLMTLQNMFPVIPLLLLISVNVSVFGLTIGYLWSLLVSIAGAVIAFMFSRYWFQATFVKYVNAKLKLKIEEKGFWFVSVGRILPFMPSSVINVAAGVSTIRFRNFFYATVVGDFVYFMVLYMISQGFVSIEWRRWF